MATTGYQAGIEANQNVISYALETVWGTPPAVQFQAIRMTSETLALVKTRKRPTEIVSTREAIQGVTTQQAASGTINIALSYGTYDDFFACAMQSPFQAFQAINGVGGDITLTSGTMVLSSTTSGKFTAISQGQWIRLLGFTNVSNNGFWWVSVKTDNTHLTLTGPNSASVITETPATTAAKVRASTLKNGTTFQSLFVQQQYSASLFLTYPGSYVSKFMLSGGIGTETTGSIDITAQNQASATSNASTGAVLAAPTGRIFDPIGGYVGGFWNEGTLGAPIDKFTLTFENTGAAGEYALGSTLAQGILGGTMTCSGTFRAYFKDFTQYTLFLNETGGRLAFILKDFAGSAYAFTFLNAVLNSNRILAGGPNQPVYSEFDVEAGPLSTGGSVVIDRLAAT